MTDIQPRIAGGTTPNYALPWPSGTAVPAGPAAFKALAQATETALNGKASAQAAANAQTTADTANYNAIQAKNSADWAAGVAAGANTKADNAINALAGKLDKSGGTISGNLTIGDNIKINRPGSSSYAANVRITADGWIQTAGSSSRRYKTDIRERDFETAGNPYGLLSVPVVTFAYNPDTHPTEDPDARHIGLIAEDVATYFPAGAEYNPDGQPETWNPYPVVAGLLALVQDLREEMDALRLEVDALNRGDA